MPWTLTLTPFDDADAELLRRAQRHELDARYGSDDHEPGAAPSAADVPVFILARDDDGAPIACGGLRPLADDVLGADVVEIKRMHVAPPARGTGVAAAVLRELEAQARLLGARRLVLETGTAQPDAIRFSQRQGYVPVALFGSYAGSEMSVCFGRDLAATRDRSRRGATSCQVDSRSSGFAASLSITPPSTRRRAAVSGLRAA